MPEEQKDTAPTTTKEDATEVSSDGLVSGGEIAAVSDQLAAVTLADHDEAGSATRTSERQQDSVNELHCSWSDPELWKPHPPTEDCPVCMVPMPLESEKMRYATCCGKVICVACSQEDIRALAITNRKREKKELPPLDGSCAFCRESTNTNTYIYAERIKNRIDNGDIEAILSMAICCRDGLEGLPKDEGKALELFNKAADMGSGTAMFHIGFHHMYVARDKKKSIEYFVEAVKMGDVESRCALAVIFSGERHFHLARKHLRLAAEAGHKTAIKQFWKLFSYGKLNKTDLEEILRAHQAACDEMDSEDRRRYDAYEEAKAGNDDVLIRLYKNYYFGYINAKQLKEVVKMHRNGSKEEEIANFMVKCYRNI